MRLLYAKVLKSLGRLGEAETQLREQSKAFPDNTNILWEVGDLLRLQGKYEESLNCFNRILFLDSFNQQAKESARMVQELLRGSKTEPAVPQAEREQASDSVTELSIRVEEAAPEAATKPAPEAEINFETETAAQLHLQQGLYPEAIGIYDRLYRRTGNPEFLRKRDAAARAQQLNSPRERAIGALQQLLERIQRQGKAVV